MTIAMCSALPETLRLINSVLIRLGRGGPARAEQARRIGQEVAAGIGLTALATLPDGSRVRLTLWRNVLPHSRAISAAAASPGGGKAGVLGWMQGLACGGLVAVLPPTALLLGALLGPALVALFLDRQAGKPVARSVLLFALAASISPIRMLWVAGQSMATSMVLATDPDVIGTAWAAAATGWLLAELTPVAVRIVLEAISRAQATRLRAARAALAEEWGFALDPDRPV